MPRPRLPAAPARRRPLTMALPTGMLAILMVCLSAGAPLARAGDTPRLATLDWTLAETLVALGAPPAGVGQVEAYHAWVGEPRLPDTAIDLGLRNQPNLERLSALDPERILVSPMLAHLAPRLSRIAPVETLDVYTPDAPTWPQLVGLTRRLAQLAGREEAGERLIRDTEAALAGLRRRLPDDTAPLLVVQFMDERHVRVFGDHSLYQAVLERLGLDNAWREATNAWGFSLVGLEALMPLEARLVVIEPLPVGVEERLADNALWRRLPSVRAGETLRLAPVWSFGGLPSARRFAGLLAEALGEDADG